MPRVILEDADVFLSKVQCDTSKPHHKVSGSARRARPRTLWYGTTNQSRQCVTTNVIIPITMTNTAITTIEPIKPIKPISNQSQNK